jgi:hypothetical protein
MINWLTAFRLKLYEEYNEFVIDYVLEEGSADGMWTLEEWLTYQFMLLKERICYDA